MGRERACHRMRVAREPDGFEHPGLVLGKGIQEGGDEHVPAETSDHVEM